MECYETNSSLDTVLILDCTDDIKPDKLKKNSSLDTLILNYEDVPKKQHRHYKSKREHRRRSLNQRMKNTDIKVTQEVHVEQQDFKCLINLNTTVCGHNNIHTKRYDIKIPKKPKTEDRIVPHCLRQQCCRTRHYKTKFCRPTKDRKTHYQQTRDVKMHECKKDTKRSKQSSIHKNRHSTHKIRHSQEKKLNKEKRMPKQNEPKPNSPKEQLELYEDISTASLDDYLEIPTSYRYVENHSKAEHHESKLDTLIKRTKERERKLVSDSRNVLRYSSTPYTEISSVEFPVTCSDIDVSLHSRSTLILEPTDHGYSSSIEGLCRSSAKYSQYSQRSEDCLLTQCLQKSDFDLKIKSEPTMDIDAYSPTQRPDYSPSQKPDLQELFEIEINDRWIKKEIKIEPLFQNKL